MDVVVKERVRETYNQRLVDDLELCRDYWGKDDVSIDDSTIFVCIDYVYRRSWNLDVERNWLVVEGSLVI